jgi:hypothetical protein
MTERKARATATAKTNTGVLHCVQDDDEKLANATASATARATAKATARATAKTLTQRALREAQRFATEG